MKNKIIIIGGGGHAKSLIDLINSTRSYKIVGIVDPNIKIGTKILDIKVLGTDNKLNYFRKMGIKFLALGLGSEGNNQKRFRLWKKFVDKGFRFPKLIHKKSIISKHSLIHDGVQVFANSVINAGSVIRDISVINTHSVVEHDCKIGLNVFTGIGVKICGRTKIDNNVFLGANSCILPKIKIEKNALIAAGALVNKDIKKNLKVKGVPAKKFS